MVELPCAIIYLFMLLCGSDLMMQTKQQRSADICKMVANPRWHEAQTSCWKSKIMSFLLGVLPETMIKQSGHFKLPFSSAGLNRIPFEHFHFSGELELISYVPGLVKPMGVLVKLWIMSDFGSASSTCCFLQSHHWSLIYAFVLRNWKKKIWLTVLPRHLTDIGI